MNERKTLEGNWPTKFGAKIEAVDQISVVLEIQIRLYLE